MRSLALLLTVALLVTPGLAADNGGSGDGGSGGSCNEPCGGRTGPERGETITLGPGECACLEAGQGIWLEGPGDSGYCARVGGNGGMVSNDSDDRDLDITGC